MRRLAPLLLVVLALAGVVGLLRSAGVVLPAAASVTPPEDGPAAERVVAGLSLTSVAITTGFSGSEIFIYGAIKREAPPPEGELGVVVAVIGPSKPVLVRKRERSAGVWMNGPGVHIDAAPSFYAVATSRDYFDTISYTDDLRYRVGLSQVIRLIDAPAWVETERNDYLAAVVRVRQNAGLYFEAPGGVSIAEDTLFDTRVELPPTLVEGVYRARIFLTRDREVVDVFETAIDVRKEGLERFITELAAEQGLVYGIGSILIALVAGWLASALFRMLLP